MADLRLTGNAVRALRTALDAEPLARLAWKFVSRDFHLPELLALPGDALAPLDPAPVPQAGRAPRSWHDAGHAPPTATAGRTTGAVLRGAFAQGMSPVDVLERILEVHARAGARSPFLEVDAARAHQAAEASAERWARGEPLSPIDGLLIPVKDEFHMEGLPTRGGTAYQNECQRADAWVVSRLRVAGAVVVAKTHAVEWGLNPCGVMEHHVGPRNVYDPNRAPGGSSTGSGVAPALGWVPSAVGTDGGGSIRIPSALNGIFGLKPTYLRVGRTGGIWGASTVAHTGPLGQSVEDLVDQLEATAGEDPNDPITRWAPDGHDAGSWRQALGRGVKGARIGVARAEFEDAEPGIVRQVEAALRALEAEGAVLVDVELPFGRMINGIGAVTIGGEASGNQQDDFRTHGAQYGDELAILLRLISMLSAPEYLRVRRARAALRQGVAQVFGDVDLIALPTTARTAPVYRDDEDLTAILDTQATAAMTRFNFLGNLTGLPAGTVPAGMAGGLPVGLQFVGDAWDEASVIAAMAHAERVGITDHVRRPSGFFDPLSG